MNSLASLQLHRNSPAGFGRTARAAVSYRDVVRVNLAGRDSWPCRAHSGSALVPGLSQASPKAIAWPDTRSLLNTLAQL